MRILLILALIFCLVGCSGHLAYPDDDPPLTQVIFVTSHGWHTGLVLPAQTVFAQIPALAERFPQARLLEIGWGDEGFYQADEITSGLTLQALLWPSPSVMHVVAMWGEPKQVFPQAEQQRLCLSDTALQKLLEFVAGSFALDPMNQPVPLRAGIYGNSQFYRAEGSYHAFNTCNRWTARALTQASIPRPAGLYLRAQSVMDWLESLPAPFHCHAESLK